jgi:hypothetical protein
MADNEPTANDLMSLLESIGRQWVYVDGMLMRYEQTLSFETRPDSQEGESHERQQ